MTTRYKYDEALGETVAYPEEHKTLANVVSVAKKGKQRSVEAFTLMAALATYPNLAIETEWGEAHLSEEPDVETRDRLEAANPYLVSLRGVVTGALPPEFDLEAAKASITEQVEAAIEADPDMALKVKGLEDRILILEQLVETLTNPVGV